jgi:SAM-dependent methyltransferase
MQGKQKIFPVLLSWISVRRSSPQTWQRFPPNPSSRASRIRLFASGVASARVFVRVADVGCGRGRGLIKLAQAFPACRYFGYDLYGPAINEATARAKAAAVHDQVTFQQADVSNGLPGEYDVITTFDVIHDAVDPLGLLRVLRRALAPDGVYVCVDINCSDKLEENIGPLGALFHGFSVLYCMTTSLAWGGAGLGTVGFHEKKVHELCSKAGFRSVRRVPIENPFNNLYEITP